MLIRIVTLWFVTDAIRIHVDTNRVSHDHRQHTHGIRHGHTCFSRVMSWSCDWRRRKNACSDVPKFKGYEPGFYMRHVALQQVSIPYRVIPYIFRNIGTNRLQPAPLLGFSLFRSCTFPFRLPNNEAFVPKLMTNVASFLSNRITILRSWLFHLLRWSANASHLAHVRGRLFRNLIYSRRHISLPLSYRIFSI